MQTQSPLIDPALVISKDFAIRIIEEMINDYIRNIRIIQSSKDSEAIKQANTENAQLKEYLLLDIDKPLLDLLDNILHINSRVITRKLIIFLERVDEETNMLEHSKISSRRIVKSSQNSFFE